MADPEVRALLHQISDEYPEALRAAEHNDVERIAFHIELVLERKGRACTLIDIGGGVGLFSVGCSALGMDVTLVDDFQDQVNLAFGDAVLDIHRRHGVRVLSRNVVDEGLSLDAGSLDVVTSFDSMEHWHRSPKMLFRGLRDALSADGLFVLGVPNCVNLRKRLTVPLGSGKWSAMQDWYEPESFRGHVREPDVDDLRYIARDLELRDVEILGRNWHGHGSRRPMVRTLTRLIDGALRHRPSLCSDIYLLGRKREA